MLEQAVRKITRQLELLAKCEIRVERALDLLESTTQNLEEIVAINILRESMDEIIRGNHAAVTSSEMGYLPQTASFQGSYAYPA